LKEQLANVLQPYVLLRIFKVEGYLTWTVVSLGELAHVVEVRVSKELINRGSEKWIELKHPREKTQRIIRSFRVLFP